MSSDTGGSQPGAGTEKTQLPPAIASLGSSVINKSTRKFAPKAIQRRRPSGPPASELSSVLPDPSTASSANAQTPQATQTGGHNAAPGPQPPKTALLQGAATVSTHHTEAPVGASTLSTTKTASSNATLSLTPTVVINAAQEQLGGAGSSRGSPIAAPAELQLPEDDGSGSGRPSKRRRLASAEPPAGRPSQATEQSQPSENTTNATQHATPNPPTLSQTPNQESAPVADTSSPASPQATASASENLALPTPTPSTVTTPQPGESRISSQADTLAAPTPSIATPQTEPPGPPSPPSDTTDSATRSKKRRRAPATQALSAKSRGKRKATEEAPREDGEGEQLSPVAKKPRKVRKDKGTKRKAPATEEADEDGAADIARPKPKRARKRKKTTTETEAEGGAGTEDGEQEPRQRGRRKRAPTPEEAEDYEVHPDATMSSLAVADTRRGKLSTREKQMREINWDEVKKRRAERALQLAQTGGANSTEVDERLEQAAQERNAANEVPQFIHDEDGNIVLNTESLVRDRQAEAAQDEDILEAIEEDDLTNRFNMGSHVLANRRDPAERVRGAPKKWTIEETNEFYNALTIFGTDFGMVATLFPGKSRRSIKLKFVREERDDSERIKEALIGRKEPVSFEKYLEMSGRDVSSFKDPRELEAELKEIDDANQVEIDNARKEYIELQRQKQLAGADSDEGGEGGVGESAKDNRGKAKGRKEKEKRKKKHKGQPIGGEEVEVLEMIDD